MFKKLNENVFDSILKTAFNEYVYQQFEKEPSEEELNQKYPLPKREQRTAKRLSKKVEFGKPAAIVYLQRACIIVLVCVSAFTAVLASSPTVRASVADTVVSWYEKYAVVDFNTDYSGSGETEPETTEAETEPVTVEDLQIGYIPEGFELVSADEMPGLRNYTYTNIDKYLVISITQTGISNATVDIEHTTYVETMINKNIAYLFYNTNEKAGTLTTGNDEYTISIFGYLEENELIKVAENIK